MSGGNRSPTIRPFKHEDIDIINDLLRTHYPWTEYETTFELSAEDIADAGTALVAIVNGDLAGFVWWLPTGAFDRSGYLKLLGVHRNHQSVGIGTSLMNAMESAVFDDAGVSDCFLLVSRFNEDARAFYRRRGYDDVGPIDGYVERGIDETLMRKMRPDA